MAHSFTSCYIAAGSIAGWPPAGGEPGATEGGQADASTTTLQTYGDGAGSQGQL